MLCKASAAEKSRRDGFGQIFGRLQPQVPQLLESPSIIAYAMKLGLGIHRLMGCADFVSPVGSACRGNMYIEPLESHQ